MNVAELAATLSAVGLAPVYVIHGPEAFFRIDAVRLIKEAAEAAVPGIDILTLESDDRLEAQSLLCDLHTPSLFSPKRLMIIDPAEKLIATSVETLAQYAEKPSSSATLVLVAAAFDARLKGVKSLRKAATPVSCTPLKQGEIPRWCVAQAKATGKLMNTATARLLIELAGTRLAQLDGHIKNLAAYCSERKAIVCEDVEQLIGGDRARKLWDVTDAVMNRDPAKALKALDRLLREPRSVGLMLIAPMAKKLRHMMHVKRLLDAGNNPTQISKILGIHPYPAELMATAVRSLSPADLAAKYSLLLESDVDMKSLSSRERRWVIERLLLRLCGIAA